MSRKRRKVRPLGVVVLLLMIAVPILAITLIVNGVRNAGGETPAVTRSAQDQGSGSFDRNTLTPSSSKKTTPVETETETTAETAQTATETATAETATETETKEPETKEPEPAVPVTSSESAQTGTKAADIVELARKLIGKPWVYGAKGPNAFDNTGFVSYVCKENGVRDKMVTVADMKKAGTEVKKEDLKPGDIVIFTNAPEYEGYFVGIYIGDDQFIASFNDKKPVSAETMKDGSYWGKHYIGARRVV